MSRDRALEKIAHLRRPAWIPRTEEGEGSPAGSRFGGRPWLPEGEEWPRCPSCGQGLQLFLQLDLAALPAAAREGLGAGLLQLFYCTTQTPLCEVDCQAFFPFARSVLARRIDPARPGALAGEGGPSERFPAWQIRGWQEVADYPNWEERQDLGAALSDEEEDALDDLPREGDKLRGWPAWVQGVEYPSCPDCQAPMSLVFQLASEDNLPWMFGDAGTGHLTVCPTHLDRLAFGWACG